MILNPSRTHTTLWQNNNFQKHLSKTALHKNTQEYNVQGEENRIKLGIQSLSSEEYKTQSYFTHLRLSKTFELLKIVFDNLSFIVNAKDC